MRVLWNFEYRSLGYLLYGKHFVFVEAAVGNKDIQMEDHDYDAGQTYSVEGGDKGRVCLLELNAIYREITDCRILIAPILDDRSDDIP